MPAAKLKTASGWQDISLVGAQGPPGIQGIKGPTGPQGPNVPITPMPDDLNKVSLKGNGTGGGTGGFAGSYEVWSAAGGDLRQIITTSKKIWWEVEAWTIVRIIDAAWGRIDFQLWADLGYGTDADGKGNGPVTITATHNALPWQTVYTRCVYKLNAGISFGVRPVLTTQGYTWEMFVSGTFTGSASKVVGYW